VQILTISQDSHDEAKGMIEQIKYATGALDFPMLSDYDHQVLDAYGIRNSIDHARPAMPHPVTYLINKQGVVAHRFIDAEHGTRPTNEQIRAELKKMGAVH
jgi:peroxiredoxin